MIHIFSLERKSMKKEIGVYIHIPFCKSKCYYCDFISFADKNEIIQEYINAVIQEIQNANLEKYSIKTVYIGGGTPSVIDSKYIVKILEVLKPDITVDVETTIEVNPGTVSEKKLKDYVNAGINRISIGLQSTKNELLREIRKNT